MVAGFRQRHGHRHHAVRIEAGIDLIQAGVTPRQQARGNQQRGGERDLADDEHGTEPARAAAASRGPRIP